MRSRRDQWKRVRARTDPNATTADYPVVMPDACPRCDRPFRDGEMSPVVVDASEPWIGLGICSDCTGHDRMIGCSKFLQLRKESPYGPPAFIPRASATGFLKLAFGDDGRVRLSMKRGHVERWTRDDVNQIGMQQLGSYGVEIHELGRAFVNVTDGECLVWRGGEKVLTMPYAKLLLDWPEIQRPQVNDVRRKDDPMPHANVRFHRNDTGLVVALSTNATDEGDFLAAITDSITDVLKREVFDPDNQPLANEAQILAVCDLFNIQLGRVLPQVIEVACRLRGYKADVVEHRVIVAGTVVPANLVELFPNELAEKA